MTSRISQFLTGKSDEPEPGEPIVQTDIGYPSDAPPPSIPPVDPASGPWSEDVIPSGWARYPTAEEVAYLNATYYPQE